MFFPSIVAFAVLFVACLAVIGFPAYHWAKDRERRALHIWTPGFVGVIIMGLCGVAAVLSFLFAR